MSRKTNCLYVFISICLFTYFSTIITPIPVALGCEKQIIQIYHYKAFFLEIRHQNYLVSFRKFSNPHLITCRKWELHQHNHQMDLQYIRLSKLFMFSDYEGISDGTIYTDCSPERPPMENMICTFQDRWLSGKCQKAERWGYNRDSPCILLTPNMVRSFCILLTTSTV